MSEPTAETPAPKVTARPLLGLAGCGIIFMLTALGALVGGLVGMAMLPPAPARAGEMDGLLYLLVLFFRLVNGLIHSGVASLVGGTVGFVVGVVVARKHCRRVRAATKPGNASQE